MSNCRIRIADPEAGDLHSRDGQCRPEAHGALPFQAFGEGSNPVGDAGPEIRNGLGAFLYAARFKSGFGRAFSLGTGSLVAGVAALAHRVAVAVGEPKRHGV
jgi:hypothetical protein